MSGAFELTVEGALHAFLVVEFRGKERMSKPYSFDVLLVGPAIDRPTVEQGLLGRPAHLRLSSEPGRWVHGVVGRFEREGVGGMRDEKHRYRVRLVPALRLLGKSVQSRIFQDQSAQAIVTAVLGESGVRQAWRLGGSYEPRRYCVQHQESDLHFVERLLREEGIFYWFEQPDAPDQAEIMVLCDSAAMIRPASGPALLRFRDEGEMRDDGTVVHRFRLQHRVEPGRVHLKDFDFNRPSFDVSAAAEQAAASAEDAVASLLSDAGLGGLASGAGLGDLASTARRAASGDLPGALLEEARSAVSRRVGALGLSGLAGAALAELTDALGIDGVLEPTDVARPDELERYDHHGELEGGRLDPQLAARHLEQYRRRALCGFGESRAAGLLPGRSFTLAGCPLEDHDGDYLVVELEHEGHDPSSFAAGAGRAAADVYRNAFVCVPAGVPFRPKRPRRQVQQVMETATVVGPSGSEVHADALGRIKVQFHWDRGGARDEHASCWIRVAQPWAGAGWGTQFLPRVGMEVLVAFLAGDTDRPVVLGSVYNAEHPPPFPPPAGKTKSGIRTQSSRGGDGHSELSFEDRKGFELVHLRAQKDLDVLARNNETHRVGQHYTAQIGGNSYALVSGNQLVSVNGDATSAVAGATRERIEGERRLDVSGGEVVAIGQARDERVGADARLRVGGRETREIEGAAMLRAARDYTVRVHGNFTTVVGDAEHPRSTAAHTFGPAAIASSDHLELRAEKGVHLVCGSSSIHLLPDRIDLHATDIGIFAGGARVVLGGDEARLVGKDKAIVQSSEVDVLASGASLTLTGDAALKGGKVALSGSSSASDSPPSSDVHPTRIELVDQDSHPVPNQRFVIRLGGGGERAGTLDEHGKAELEIRGGGSATIAFPDAAEGGSSGGSTRPHVVQQGEYLTQLAFRHGFDAQEVWSSSDNEDLRNQRSNPEMLLPGDVLHVPAEPPPARSLTLESSNRFTVRIPMAEATVRLVDAEGHAMNGEPYRIEGAGAPIEGSADGDGNVRVRVPVTVHEVTLVLPRRRASMRVLVGYLDPIEHDAGVRQRLTSLGYLGNRPGPTEIQAAIRRFQADEGLDATGDMNDDTRARLLERHGS